MMGFGFGGFGLVFMILFWAAVIAVAVWVLGTTFPRATDRSSQASTADGPGRSENPLDILKRRYAGGEISRSEYEAVRRELRE